MESWVQTRLNKKETKEVIKRFLKVFFPPGSGGFVFLSKIAVFIGLTPPLPPLEINYSHWTERVEPLTWSHFKDLQYEPMISLVVPVFNPQASHFIAMLYSVINQTYQNWQLVLVNASTNKKLIRLTSDSRLIDSRIKVVDIEENLGIAGNTNKGIGESGGDYIGLLDHDDVLAPQALFEIALVLQDQKPEFIYSDEDKITADSEFRIDPLLKPDWSPQLMRQLNYINHFTVIKKELIKKVGGYKTGFEGAQDYDLFLRIIDEQPQIVHIPKVLYHWRTAKSSTSVNFSQKKDTLSSGVRALESHLARNHQKGEVSSIEDKPGFYRIKYAQEPDTKVAIMILPSQKNSEYRKFIYNFINKLGNLEQTMEVFVQEPRVPLKDLPKNVSMHYLKETTRKAFLRKASDESSAELCLIVGSALYIKSKKWLAELTGLMTQVKSIAIAMPVVVGADNKTIIDAGLIKLHDEFLTLFSGYKIGKRTPLGDSDWARNVDATTGRCFMIRRSFLKEAVEQIKEPGNLFFSEEFFESLQKDNKHQIVTWPFSKVVYGGEMNQSNFHYKYFNDNLSISKTEFSLLEIIRVPRSYKDE